MNTHRSSLARSNKPSRGLGRRPSDWHEPGRWPGTGAPTARLHTSLGQRPRLRPFLASRANGTAHSDDGWVPRNSSRVEDGTGLQPSTHFDVHSWGVAPGWYGAAPWVLGSAGGACLKTCPFPFGWRRFPSHSASSHASGRSRPDLGATPATVRLRWRLGLWWQSAATTPLSHCIGHPFPFESAVAAALCWRTPQRARRSSPYSTTTASTRRSIEPSAFSSLDNLEPLP